MCEDFQDICSKHSSDIGHKNLITMDVDTADSTPVSSRPYCMLILMTSCGENYDGNKRLI